MDIYENWQLEEPSADLRSAAKALREMYIALRYEGFDFREAITFIAVMSAGQNNAGDEE